MADEHPAGGHGPAGATRRGAGEYATFDDTPAHGTPAAVYDAPAHDERTEAVTTTDGSAIDPVGPYAFTPDAVAPGMTAPGAGAPEAAVAETGTRRRGPDPLALVVGLATLAMAVFAFTGELPDLGFVDPRWLLAGGAAVVGLLLLVGNLRRLGGRRGGG